MINKLLAKKQKMEQKFDQNGHNVPVTVLKAPAGVVFQIKTDKKDGYFAIQIGVGAKKSAKKPIQGKTKKIGVKTNPVVFYECLVDSTNVSEYKIGQQVELESVIKPGDRVDVQAKSKGRGFAGAIKRWGFHSQPKTHGQSDRERAPGSIGSQTPGRVFKGKKMPGHYGNEKITVKNLPVLKVDKESGEIWLGGSIPGAINSWQMIRKSLTTKKVILLEDKPVKDGKKQENQINN
jgi:large subunit ribosomal protein L3